MKLSLKLITHHSKVIIAPVLAFEDSLENGIIRLLAFETCPVLEKAFLSRFNYPTSFEEEVALQLIANPEAHLWVVNKCLVRSQYGRIYRMASRAFRF